MKSCAAPSAPTRSAAALSHDAWRAPVHRDQRPDSQNPPSTASNRPVGAYEEHSSVRGSSPQISCWIFSLRTDSPQLFSASHPANQPVDMHAEESSHVAVR